MIPLGLTAPAFSSPFEISRAVSASHHDPPLARTLVLDELFDISLSKALPQLTQQDVLATLDKFLKVETAH